MRKTNIISSVMAFLLLSAIDASAQACNRLQSTSPSAMVSYLAGTAPDHGNAACITLAINQLGNQRHEPAIPFLTKLLDFRWPVNARQKQRLFVLEHDGASVYPAATALEQIGKNALPAVLAAMKAPSTSREAMEVAVSVWMTIYKDQAPTGVALLKRDADRTKDHEARQRLGWAAFRAATGWCRPAEEAQCKAAVNTRYSN